MRAISGPTEKCLKHPGCLFHFHPKKQQLWGAQVWAWLGFAKLGAGVWLWPVPRMLLGAGFRRGRRLRGLEVVVGKTRPACFCSGVLWKGATVRGWLSLSVTRRAGYPPVVQGQKRDPIGSRCGLRVRWCFSVLSKTVL